MVKVIWTQQALVWLKEIHDYINQDNPSAAKRTVKNIKQKTQIIKSHPKAGYLHEHDFGDEYQVRILLYGHYRVAYLINSKDTVYIIGVFHGSLSLDRHFTIPVNEINNDT